MGSQWADTLDKASGGSAASWIILAVSLIKKGFASRKANKTRGMELDKQG